MPQKQFLMEWVFKPLILFYSSLPVVYLLQAHLVAAFEQSLGNMTLRLKSLTLTAEQKVQVLLCSDEGAHHSEDLPLALASSLLLSEGLRAQRTSEDHRTLEEAERCHSGRHQRSHQHA